MNFIIFDFVYFEICNFESDEAIYFKINRKTLSKQFKNCAFLSKTLPKTFGFESHFVARLFLWFLMNCGAKKKQKPI